MGAFDSAGLWDETALRILEELQADGRMSMAELGRRVSLSAPAVAERVRRLEDSGVITGYRAVVNPALLGYGMAAIVRLAPHIAEHTTAAHLKEALRKKPEVLDCWYTVGDDCFYLRIVVRDTEHLEQFLEAMMPLGKTSTAIVLSTTAECRPVKPFAG